ncbi:SDR family oxidoreductase [Candidatus Azambacteria bacterium]|nr:SDR family oxidoreductase [Candidatus Azambacteria bacterium]MBI3685101.1 SDR family oxidoreductase [Candidatus Azambacteria bacterium]
MDIKNKTIILTGAARVGKSVAKMLGERGANLVITYLHSKKEADFVCEGCKEAGSQAIEVRADLSKAADVAEVVKEAKRAFGRIDGLVHMAASYPKTPWETLKEEDWGRTMDIIAKSTFLLGKAVGDELLKNKGDEVRSNGGVTGRVKGKIVTISDWSVLARPYKDYLPYNAAKAAVEGLTIALAKELAPYVTVNAVAPGPILAPPGLTHEENAEVLSKTPLARWGGPEEIAKAVLYFFEADFVTGVVLPVDGGRTIG